MTDKRLRLAFVITDSGVGGTEKTLTFLLHRLDRALIDIAGVVILKKIQDHAVHWRTQGFPVVALQMGRWPTPFTLWRLRRYLRAWQPDMVHALLYHSAQLTRMVRLSGVPFQLITSPRVNYRFIPLWARYLDRVLKNQDVLTICESQASVDFLNEKMGYPVEKLRAIRNGVESVFFTALPEIRSHYRMEWKLAEQDCAVGAAGRLAPQKGYDILIDACAQLSKQHKNFKLIIAGEGPDRSMLENKAKTLGVPMILLGKRPDMPDVLNAFDIFVQSSRFEGLSNALLESMAMGKAIVATDVDGTREAAGENSGVTLVPAENPTALAEALRPLLLSADERQQKGKQARQKAADFSLDTMLASYQQIYSDSFQKEQG